MVIIFESFREEWQNLLRIFPRLIIALIILLVSIWLGRLLGRFLIRFIEKGDFSQTHKKFFQGLTSWIIALIGLILALNVLHLRGIAASLLASGGMTAIVLGFAFREIGENVLAGTMLAFQRPFEVGDYIQSEELQGTVKGIEIRYTHIRTVDGRDIFIPSSQIVNKPLINFTRDGLLRPTFTVGIDYADDSENARRLILEAVKTSNEILQTPPPDVIVSAFNSQYLEIQAFFWVDTFKPGKNSQQIRSDLIEKCLRALLAAGFTLSSNVTTNVELSEREPVDLRLVQS